MSGLGRQETRTCGSRCRACAAPRASAPLAVAKLGIEHVQLDDLAEAARIRASDVHAHAHGDVMGVLGAAYLESAGALQRGFAWSWRQAPTPREGLNNAVGWLLTTLAEDPARALFCYVEIIKGGRPLRRLREQVRQGSVGIWTTQYTRDGARQPTADQPLRARQQRDDQPHRRARQPGSNSRAARHARRRPRPDRAGRTTRRPGTLAGQLSGRRA